MIKNPQNIENDIVLTHGRWCLDQCMTEAGAKALLPDHRVPVYAEHERQIKSIMDQRRADLVADKVVYCPSLDRR